MATFRRKQIKTTVTVVVGAILMLCDLIVNVPQAIQTLASRGPDWMSEPRVWIGVVIVTVTAISIWLIWKKPDQEEFEQLVRDTLRRVGMSQKALVEATKKISSTAQRSATLLSTIEDFHYQLLTSYALGRTVDRNYALGRLEVSIPLQVKSDLGDSIHDRFVSIVKDSRKRSKGNLLVICEAAFSYLEREIWNVIFAEEKKRDEGTKSPSGG